jgi:hypothetical protein
MEETLKTNIINLYSNVIVNKIKLIDSKISEKFYCKLINNRIKNLEEKYTNIIEIINNSKEIIQEEIKITRNEFTFEDVYNDIITNYEDKECVLSQNIINIIKTKPKAPVTIFNNKTVLDPNSTNYLNRKQKLNRKSKPQYPGGKKTKSKKNKKKRNSKKRKTKRCK